MFLLPAKNGSLNKFLHQRELASLILPSPSSYDVAWTLVQYICVDQASHYIVC